MARGLFLGLHLLSNRRQFFAAPGVAPLWLRLGLIFVAFRPGVGYPKEMNLTGARVVLGSVGGLFPLVVVCYPPSL